jgi:hypothetical protein
MMYLIEPQASSAGILDRACLYSTTSRNTTEILDQVFKLPLKRFGSQPEIIGVPKEIMPQFIYD